MADTAPGEVAEMDFGRKVVGYKVAFTGKATQEAFGVDAPAWTAVLTENLMTEGDDVSM